MKLLILGATGGIGLELVRQAIEHGHQVTAFVRTQERLKEFVGRMQNAPTEPENGTPKQNGKVSLKTSCDRQIVLFNDLGITVGVWYSQSEPLVEIFPHAAIFIWIILHPYIIQRRKDTVQIHSLICRPSKCQHTIGVATRKVRVG